METPTRKSVYTTDKAAVLLCPADRFFSRIRICKIMVTTADVADRYFLFGHYPSGAQGALAPLGLQGYSKAVAASKTAIFQLGERYTDFDATEIASTLVFNRHFDGILRPTESISVSAGNDQAGDTFRTFIEYFDEPYDPEIHG